MKAMVPTSDVVFRAATGPCARGETTAAAAFRSRVPRPGVDDPPWINAETTEPIVSLTSKYSNFGSHRPP